MKLANAEKEKAELKAEMVGKMQANMQKEVEQSEADKAASEEHGRMMEKKVSELSFGLTELRDQLHNLVTSPPFTSTSFGTLESNYFSEGHRLGGYQTTNFSEAEECHYSGPYCGGFIYYNYILPKIHW